MQDVVLGDLLQLLYHLKGALVDVHVMLVMLGVLMGLASSS